MITLALLVAIGPGQVQPAPSARNTCVPPSDCRFIPAFTLRSPRGDVRVPVDGWSPVFWQGRLMLAPGESAVLVLDRTRDKATPKVVSIGRADRVSRDHRDKAMEEAALAMSGDAEEHLGRHLSPGGVAATRAEPGTIRVTLEQAEGRADMMLKVDNGYEQDLDYAAAIVPVHSLKAEHTTVCPVPAGELVTESWPYPILQVQISDFKFVKLAGEITLSQCD